MITQRSKMLSELSTYIHNIKLNHPIRVAINGVDTSGKTTLANELVEPLKQLGRPVIRASVDRFHNPRDIRYEQGKDSPNGYYNDSFNNKAIIEKLLSPLGKRGSLEYEDVFFDFKTDSKLHSTPKKSDINAILLFDGVFLLRQELNPYWDVRIFLQIPFDEVLKRALIRDKKLMGDEVERKYKLRYIPGQKLYLNSVHPEQIADIVIDNSNFNSPSILKWQINTSNYV